MPVRRVGKTAHGPQPTAPASERRFDRSPYPHVRARAGANDSSFHSVAPASLDAGQPAYPLLPSQALDTPDLVSVDDVSGDPAERDGSWDPAGPASNATGNEDEPIQNTSNRQETRRIPAKLELLDMFEWDQDKLYDESPPTCLHYSIEWKVTLNNKPIAKDTEQDLVLAPQYYWSLFLRPKLKKLVEKKLSSFGDITCDDTSVVVSNTGRTERPLTKRFDEIDIDWFIVERQLTKWGELFRAGKKLRVELSFNYFDKSHQVPGPGTKKTSKQGYSSASRQMLAERASELDAEEVVTGQPAVWRDVYDLMRCPGPPCSQGPHCWQDPVGKKHYKLYTSQLQSLVQHVKQGGILRTHNDIPKGIRQQLYAAENEHVARRRKKIDDSASKLPSIVIKNVLPGPSGSAFTQGGMTLASNRLIIPGPCDTAVEEYSEWQISRVEREELKEGIRDACSIALTEGFDLVQIHEDRDPDFFVRNGVKLGIARRFVRDIEYWVKCHKCINDPETSSDLYAAEYSRSSP